MPTGNRLYETPGHTEDHLVIHLEDDNSLFSGDCILGEGSTVFEDLLTYLKSLQRIRNLNPSRIYPGHGPVIDDPATKVEEYINHRLQRERQILDALATNPECAVDVQDIVAKLYPDLSENLVLGAISNIYKHLVKLIKEDRVVMIGAMPINHEQLKSSEPPRFWLKQKKTY